MASIVFLQKNARNIRLKQSAGTRAFPETCSASGKMNNVATAFAQKQIRTISQMRLAVNG